MGRCQHKQHNNEGHVQTVKLNRVSSTLAANVIRGIPLAINDYGLYLNFMMFITSLAEDFRLCIGHKCLTNSY